MRTSKRLAVSTVVGLVATISPIWFPPSYDYHTPSDGISNVDTPKDERAVVRASRGLTNRTRVIRFAFMQYRTVDAHAFIEIIWRESRFNPYALNENSGAYGLGQANPPSKMESVGDDWKTNMYTQLKWVAKYIEERYDSPKNALKFHNRMGWY